jgi:cytochrome oxidase Cu insertion factor (SCO1/SenC/PrrC family)
MIDSIPSDPNRPQEHRSRAQFWILVGVFFAPLLIAFLLYYGLDGWRPVGSTNHGDLVQPPTPLPHTALTMPNGGSLDPASLRGKWTVVYIGSGECDARCREALTLIRQTRLALNDDLTRVQRLFLATEPCCDETYLREQHEGLLIARLDDASGAQFKAAFQGATQVDVERAGRIYVVDPLGNLMMSYAPDAEPKGLLIDLKKLLKLSHIG